MLSGIVFQYMSIHAQYMPTQTTIHTNTYPLGENLCAKQIYYWYVLVCIGTCIGLYLGLIWSVLDCIGIILVNVLESALAHIEKPGIYLICIGMYH